MKTSNQRSFLKSARAPWPCKASAAFAARAGRLVVALVGLTAFASAALASDHLDSPATVANPQADIADVYAWTTSDGRRLNLAMTMQGHTFSEKVEYALHIDSGKVFGHTSASTVIACHFAAANARATSTA